MSPTNRRSSLFRLLLMCVVLVMSGSPGHTSGASWKGNAQRAGEEAKDFRLVDLEGKEQSLSDHRGKVVLLFFWFVTKVDYLKTIMEDLQAIHDKLHNKRLVVLTILENPDASTVAQRYIKRNGFTFPVLLDEPYKLSRQFGMSSMPFAVLIDEQGVIRRHLKHPNDFYEPMMLDILATIQKPK